MSEIQLQLTLLKARQAMQQSAGQIAIRLRGSAINSSCFWLPVRP